jgi:hypothetical protein
MQSHTRIVVGTAVAFGWASGAAAHHAFAANFDVDKTVAVEGRITTLRWQNPHVEMTLVTPQGETWRVESQAKNLLERTEIQAPMFAVGSTLKLAGYPARAGNGVFALNALLADGRELILRAGRPAYFGGTAGSKPENILAAGVADATAAKTGLFRVWSMQFAGESRWRWPGSYPLTPSGAAAQARFDYVADDPLRDCGRKGMPWIMSQPFPMQIERQGTDIVMRLEEGDTVRVIHLRDRAPRDVEPSLLGYSFGWWDGSDLVVQTVAINAPYLNIIGRTAIPLSSAVTLDERFSVTADGSRLDYALTVADPVMFTAPLTIKNYWIWRPDTKVEPYRCEPDAGTNAR